MTSTSTWFEDHKGVLLRTEGYVWYCEDDCGCTQAQVVNVYRNKVTGDSVVRELLWEGEYHSDNEPGADDELRAYRDTLDPAERDRIVWPKSFEGTP